MDKILMAESRERERERVKNSRKFFDFDFIKILAVLFCVVFLLFQITSPVCASSFSYSRSITIDHTKVGTVNNTDQSNFPVEISLSDAILKTTGNGGHVQNSNAYDIYFYSDSELTSRLPAERETYDGSVGQYVGWVKVPSVSHIANTVIYMAYGDASVGSDPNLDATYGKTKVWDDGGSNYYKGVWHLNEVSDITNKDSTSNVNNGIAPLASLSTVENVDNPVLTYGGVGTFDHGSLRDNVVWYARNKYWTLYTGASQNTTPFYPTIGLASSDDGVTWTKLGKVIAVNSTPSQWNSGALFSPGIYYDVDTDELYVYVSGTETGAEWYTGPVSIGVLKVGTGADWSDPANYVYQNSGNPILVADQGWEGAQGVYAPDVKKIGSTYTMFYSSSNAGSPWNIGTATSSSPVGPWTKYVSNPIINTGTAEEPSVLQLPDGGLLMFTDTVGGFFGVKVFSTSDPSGLTGWSLHDSLLTGSVASWSHQHIGSPTIVQKLNGDLLMMYNGYANGDSNDQRQIGFATVSMNSFTGKIGEAESFNGSSNYVNVGINASLQPTSAITISAWVNKPDTSPFQVIIGKENLFGYQLDTFNNNLTFAVKTTNNGWVGTPATSGQLNPNDWNYVVGVYNGSNITIYVNNVLISNQTTSASGNLVYGSSYTAIGVKGTSLDSWFNGLIDEVRISSTARSADWIATEYNNQNAPGNIGSADFYTVGNEISSDATLSNLVISSGTLTPTFDPSIISYTDNVANNITDITVTPTVNPSSNATIKVNGNTVTSGSKSASTTLVIGPNPSAITIVVVAEDGITISTTTIDVTRTLSDVSLLNVAQASSTELIAASSTESTTPGNHIIGSRAILIAALATATATTTDAQSVVDGQTSTLNTAISNYNAAIVGASNLTAYNAALALVSHANYTPASWTTYQTVVSANVVTISNTQAEVDAATANIISAQTNLVLLSAPVVPPTNSGGSGGSGAPIINGLWNGMYILGEGSHKPLSTSSIASTTISATSSNISSDYKFITYLKYGMKSNDVKELQKYLNSHGFVIAQSGAGSLGKETNYFGLLTYKTLIKFQETYASDILTPGGLKKGTGYFGPATIKFINGNY